MARRLPFMTAACTLAVALFMAGCSKNDETAAPGANTPMAQAAPNTEAVSSTSSSSETASAASGSSSESKPVEQENAAETKQ